MATLSQSNSAFPPPIDVIVRISLPDLPNDVPTLKTERLTLRPLAEDDASTITAIVQLPEVVAALGHGRPRTDEQVLDWIRSIPNQQSAFSRRYVFAVVVSATSKVVGLVELHPVDVVNHEADLSLWLAREARKQGLGTEAARTIVVWATQTLRLDVNGVANPDNTAAIALIEALGMDDHGELVLRSSLHGQASARVFIAKRAI